MDILNIQALITRGRIVTSSDIDPTETYVQIGIFQPGNRPSGSGNPDTYPSYVIPLSEIGKVPSLQQVLDFNHDLVGGNNYQGTSAGVGNGGADVNAFGKGAAVNNVGTHVNAFGRAAADQNTGNNLNAIGESSAQLNVGNNVNAVGSLAASANLGSDVIAIGFSAAKDNQGSNVIALGTDAGYDVVNSLPNTISQAVIISNSELPSYLNHAAALAAIGGVGAAGNTYLYYDQQGKYVGAVRL